MDKSLPLCESRSHGFCQRRSSTFLKVGALICLLVFATKPYFPSYFSQTAPAVVNGHLSSAKVIPTTSYGGSLKWTECPDSDLTQCAMFKVPMNYLDASDPTKVTLFLRKYPAKDKKLGTILTNPGGPGGSGTRFLANAAERISDVVEGRYDIVSWDPRGVNLTNPTLNCLSPEEQHIYEYDTENILLPYPWEAAHYNGTHGPVPNHILRQRQDFIQKMLANAQAMGETCAVRGNQALLRGASTASVARDMKSIMHALGEPHVQFWGFSYGTIVGATFAAMFPELSNRIVLDGVCDAQLWFNDMITFSAESIGHSGKTLKWFVDSCADTGQGKCALAAEGDTGADILKKIYALEKKLRKEPLPVPSLEKGVPVIIESSFIESSLFSVLYGPKQWPQFALALAELDKGNGTLFKEYVPEFATADSPSPFLHQRKKTISSELAHNSVYCSDSDRSSIKNMDDSGWVSVLNRLLELSPLGANSFAEVASCKFWPDVEPYDVYRGPFSLDAGMRATKFPVIFASNTADPATSMAHGESMNAAFGNSSRLLVLDAPGHCTSSAPSQCISKKLGDYFVRGILPDDGTICPRDSLSFPF